MSKQEMAKVEVGGLRKAAEVLGVSRYHLTKAIGRLQEAESSLVPRLQKIPPQGKVAYVWQTVDELRTWWDQARTEHNHLGGEQRQAKPKLARTLQGLLDEGTVAELTRLYEKLDTAEVRTLRRAQQQPDLSLFEVLTLVVGLGLAHWPDDE